MGIIKNIANFFKKEITKTNALSKAELEYANRLETDPTLVKETTNKNNIRVDKVLSFKERKLTNAKHKDNRRNGNHFKLPFNKRYNTKLIGSL